MKGATMKRITRPGACFAALCLCSTALLAAGPYDGVYQSTANPNYFLTIYQNGNSVVSTGYSNISSPGLSLSSPGGTIQPQYLDFFSLYGGTINGTQASITGYDYFRACNISMTLTFASGTVTSLVTASAASPAGIAQGVNCTVVDKVNTQVIWNKLL